MFSRCVNVCSGLASRCVMLLCACSHCCGVEQHHYNHCLQRWRRLCCTGCVYRVGTLPLDEAHAALPCLQRWRAGTRGTSRRCYRRAFIWPCDTPYCGALAACAAAPLFKMRQLHERGCVCSVCARDNTPPCTLHICPHVKKESYRKRILSQRSGFTCV
jgi:hypothetical protein